MANEPERPIEKLLRAAAKKRRDEAGAPLELHPATRRLLQVEVARTFAKPKRENRSFSEALGQLWPRFAWGAAICAVLVVAGYILLPFPGKGRPEALMAKNEPMPQAAPAKQPLPLPALAKDSRAASTDRDVHEKLAAAAALQLADRKKAAEAGIAASRGTLAQAPAGVANGDYQRQLGLAGQPAPSASMPAAPDSPAPAPTTVAAGSAVAADESLKLLGDKADQPSLAYKSLPLIASDSRPQASPVATDGLIDSTAQPREQPKSVGASQWFAQAAPGTKAKAALTDKAASAHPVLASFQVEQAGRELRIVDGDGSVYQGYVQIAEDARRLRSAKAEASSAAPTPRPVEGALTDLSAASLNSVQPAQQNYFFRVVGTNRSLHKKVVFSGNLLTTSNAPPLQSFTNLLYFGDGLGGRARSSIQPNLLPLLNSRISGKVVVGKGKAIEVNALPTNP